MQASRLPTVECGLQRGTFRFLMRVMDAPSTPTFRALFHLLMWVQWRSLLARLRGLRDQSPWLILLLVGFVFGYLALGYWLFRWGLEFLYNFPLVGALLSQRILYLIFGFFFVM